MLETNMKQKSSIYWDIKLCIPLKDNRRLGGKYRLDLHVRRISRERYQRESRWLEFFDPEDGVNVFPKRRLTFNGYTTLYRRR
jgi:hypothetical protein